MASLSCSECRRVRLAYLNGELPAHLRQPVKQHLQRCSECRKVFDHEEDIRWQLRRTLPQLGCETQPAYQRAWAGVKSRIGGPVASRLPKRYGVLLLIAMVSMVVPLVLRNPPRHDAPPTPPTPHQTSLEITPTAETAEPLEVAVRSVTPDRLTVQPLPVAGMNTP